MESFLTACRVCGARFQLFQPLVPSISGDVFSTCASKSISTSHTLEQHCDRQCVCLISLYVANVNAIKLVVVTPDMILSSIYYNSRRRGVLRGPTPALRDCDRVRDAGVSDELKSGCRSGRPRRSV